ncbi:MAG: DUF3501 family protein [Arenicellales bacterium]
MQLTRKDLFSLEEYAPMRSEYRAKVMAHKKNRAVALGPNAVLYFEDRLTMQYQIQEMLRIEKIFEAEGINEELETYNTLIPDGSNWKATFMIEFGDEDERRKALVAWKGIEKTVWMQVGDHAKVYAISNEDLARENDVKTSAVHFMRFELSDEMRASACQGAKISAGIDLDLYPQSLPLAENFQASLQADLNC